MEQRLGMAQAACPESSRGLALQGDSRQLEEALSVPGLEREVVTRVVMGWTWCWGEDWKS